MDIYDLVYLKYGKYKYFTFSDFSIGQFIKTDQDCYYFKIFDRSDLRIGTAEIRKEYKGMLNCMRPLEEVILYNKKNSNLKMRYRVDLYPAITEIDKDTTIIGVELNIYRTGFIFNTINTLYTLGELINPPPQSKKEDDYYTTPDGFQTKDENWKPGKWLI